MCIQCDDSSCIGSCKQYYFEQTDNSKEYDNYIKDMEKIEKKEWDERLNELSKDRAMWLEIDKILRGEK